MDNSIRESEVASEKLIQKVEEKSLGQSIRSAISKTVYFLILFRYRLQYPHVEFGSNVKIRGRFLIKGKGQVKIGNYCSFRSSNNVPNEIITHDASARIVIGESCYSSGVTLSAAKQGQIEIGDGCEFVNHSPTSNKLTAQDIGARIKLEKHCYLNGARIFSASYIEIKEQCLVSDALVVDTDYHSVEINRRDPKIKSKAKPICIGENVWLGAKSVVMKGVTIGKNSVVGMGTIVRQAVPENVVVIGNPQQVVKKLDTSIQPYDFPA